MSAVSDAAVIAAILGSGGIGVLVGIPYAKRKARADVSCREAEARKTLAEAAHTDEMRTAVGVETLTAILAEANNALTAYQTRLCEQGKLLDEAIAQSSSVGEALHQARHDLLEHSRTIDRLRSRIRQLEQTLTEHGIAIPKERRQKGTRNV